MSDYPNAVVCKDENGNLYLDDPTALGMIEAIDQHNHGIAIRNCLSVYEAQRDRVNHFQRRIKELGRTPADTVIVLINVDDPNGKPIADALMPGFNWQEIRDRGEVPFARGLAGREGMEEIVSEINPRMGAYMKTRRDVVCVVLVDQGIVQIYTPKD